MNLKLVVAQWPTNRKSHPVSGTQNLAFPQSVTAAAPSYLNISGKSVSIEANNIVVAGAILTPGAPAITDGGTLVSLGVSTLVVGTHTKSMILPGADVAPSHITFGGEGISVQAYNIVVGGSTLKPGRGGVTVDEMRDSLGDSVLVVGSQTTSFMLPSPAAAPSQISIGGHTITVAASIIVFAGATLTPGAPPTTANGTPISLGSSVLVIGTQTTTFTVPTATGITDPGGGTGAAILSNLHEIDTETVAAPTTAFGDSWDWSNRWE